MNRTSPAPPSVSLCLLAIAVFSVILVSRQAAAADLGPVNADVLRVLDGDTVEVRAAIWLDQSLVTKVRLAGVDAPDRDCPAERERTAERVRGLLGPNTVLSSIQWGKYAGRVLARMATRDGADLSDVLVREGLAKTYGGKGPRPRFC